MSNPQRWLIGVDGGGSKTAVSLGLLDEAGRLELRGQGIAGASNPLVVGYETACANIVAAVRDAFPKDTHAAEFNSANTEPSKLIAAGCFSIAGCGNELRQAELGRHLKSCGLFETILFSHDADAVLSSPANLDGLAPPAGQDASSLEITRPIGVALIAGTGSISFGRNVRGKTSRAGGWGFRFGDEGSGYWIAIRGLAAASKMADSRGDKTLILDGMLSRLDLKSTDQIVDRVYANDFGRSEIAKLSSVVFEAAGRKDGIALAIVEDALSELKLLVHRIVVELNLQPQCYVVNLAGGVLLNNDEFREALVEQIEKFDSPPSAINAVSDPSLGALILASQAE